jgi:PAS domain S-box-containing protein
MSPTLDVNPQEMLRPPVAVESHLTLAPCGQILQALRHLVSRFRRSYPLAARSRTNVGTKGTLATLSAGRGARLLRHAILWIVRSQINRLWRPAAQFLLGSVGLALLTLVCFRLQLNLASAAFGYLIVIVLLSLMGSFVSSIILSIVAVGCLNYFLAPPIFDFRIDYPFDALAVIGFLTASLVVTGLMERARRLKEQFKLVVDNIPAVVWSKRRDGSADFLNQYFQDYTGISMREGRGWGWMNAFHPDDRVTDEWRAVLAAGEPFEKEARLRRADGQYRWFALRAVPLRDERGNVVKWYGTTTEIEDRKQAEARVRQEAS